MAANKSHIFFQECNKIIEHVKKNFNLAILHRSLVLRIMSYEKIKKTQILQCYVGHWY